MGTPPRVKAAVGTGGGGAAGGAVTGCGETRPVACGADMVPVSGGDAGVADGGGSADDTPRALESIGTVPGADEDEVGRAVGNRDVGRALRWCGAGDGGSCSGAGRLAESLHHGACLYPNCCLPSSCPHSECVRPLFLLAIWPHMSQWHCRTTVWSIASRTICWSTSAQMT